MQVALYTAFSVMNTNRMWNTILTNVVRLAVFISWKNRSIVQKNNSGIKHIYLCDMAFIEVQKSLIHWPVEIIWSQTCEPLCPISSIVEEEW